jgi:hypothetical protein
MSEDRFHECSQQFPQVWAQALSKRRRRLDYALAHGSVRDGWTPPNPNDWRSVVRPEMAFLARAPRRIRKAINREELMDVALLNRMLAMTESE